MSSTKPEVSIFTTALVLESNSVIADIERKRERIVLGSKTATVCIRFIILRLRCHSQAATMHVCLEAICESITQFISIR